MAVDGDSPLQRPVSGARNVEEEMAVDGSLGDDLALRALSGTTDGEGMNVGGDEEMASDGASPLQHSGGGVVRNGEEENIIEVSSGDDDSVLPAFSDGRRASTKRKRQ